MKVGIIGVGYVGTACAKAMLLRGSCHEIVLIDLPNRQKHTQGVRNDLLHGSPLCPPVRLTVGDYPDLHDAAVIAITAGINEGKGNAVHRDDRWGRQRLLPANALVYREVVEKIVEQSTSVPIVVVTDPPDSLADIARTVVQRKGGQNQVISTGTYLDSLRFRIQIAERLSCSAASVDAFVIGEHGKSQVYVWSSARVGGTPLADLIPENYDDAAAFYSAVQRDVIDANIDIIEATDASQHGIGIVTARIVEAMLRGDGHVAPVGVWQEAYGVTLSLPSVIGKGGVQRVLNPALSPAEQASLKASAALVAQALDFERRGVPVKDWGSAP